MFKFRRKRTNFVAVRAEELVAGDRLMDSSVISEILEVIQHPEVNMTVVRLGPTHPESVVRTRQIGLYRDQFVMVVR